MRLKAHSVPVGGSFCPVRDEFMPVLEELTDSDVRSHQSRHWHLNRDESRRGGPVQFSEIRCTVCCLAQQHRSGLGDRP